MVAEAAVLTPLGWLVSPLITMLFNKAHDHLGTNMDERRKILAATVLPRLSLAIEKAEKSPNKDKLEVWLKRLKDAYYRAEEAIDLFEYEKLKQKVKDERGGTRISSSKLEDCLSIFSQRKNKLKVCIDELIEIAEEAKQFGDLLEVPKNASGNEPERETTSDCPNRVFGRERDKEHIVGLLTEKPLSSRPSILVMIKNMVVLIVGLFTIKPLNSRPTILTVIKNMIEFIVGLFTKKPSSSEPGPSTRPAIPIIAIMGRSGVGKTTLAQYVYKHMDEQKHFDLPVWVHAPRKFKATDVIKLMIENIEAKKDTPTSHEALLKHTRNMLGSKKLLLVLDDFWSDTEDFEEQWEKFFGFFSSCLPGSRILLTTQSAHLVNFTEVETYYLQDIEENQFSDLFMHYAWAPRNSHLQKEEFEEVGRKIALKLKGDPGAAKLVGHQLSRKLDLKYWEEIAEKDWLGDNMKARIWSYQQLPLDLQRCFSICCLFPKGKLLAIELIITFWLAEGFISPNDKQERLEDIGVDYLHELVLRFFLEKVVQNEKTYCKLHDLFHDLAVRVQGDDLIRIDSTNSGQCSSHISNMLSRSENIRHICLPSSMIFELKEKLCLMKNIRTFWVEPDGVFVPKKVWQEIFKHLKKLQVLQLPECGDDLPDSIGNLKHLRFMFVNGFQTLKKLPDSICKLYHLQSLMLPKCESLPKDFSDLISLRGFATYEETRSHISHIGRLTSLQSIPQFVVRKKRGHELHQLENLNQLHGELCISGLENVKNTADAVKANMQNKKHLEKIEFEWNVTCRSAHHVQLLDALQPHPKISAVTIKRFGGDRLPNWLRGQNSLRHLTALILLNCDHVEEISFIPESLPKCKILVLWWLNNLKKMPSLPPNLTYLSINLPQLGYFSEDDLMMKEEGNQSDLEIMTQIAECPNINKNEDSKLVLPSSVIYLAISSCSITCNALSTSIQCLGFLSELKLCNIRTITSLPPKEVLCILKNLQSLIIKHCVFLNSLGGIGALTSLIELKLKGCLSLSTSNEPLPSSLERIKFWDCSNVDVILAKSNLPVLLKLYVHYTMLTGQKGVLRVHHMSGLKDLHIMGWDGRLEGLNSLKALHSLFVACCPEINPSSPADKYQSALPNVTVDNLSQLKFILSNETISSIDSLVIYRFHADSRDDEIFQSLTSIKILSFYSPYVTHMPKNLKDLLSLQYMFLTDCPNLCELEELPKNLHQLEIKDCPTLTEKFNKDGPYRVRFQEGSTIVTFPTEEERNRF